MHHPSDCENLPVKHNKHRLPKTYKDAAVVVKQYIAKKGTLKSIIYEGAFRDKRRLLPMVSSVLSKYKVICDILSSIKIFDENPKFDHAVAAVLASEIVRHKRSLTGDCKQITTINKYAKQIQEKFVMQGETLSNSCQLNYKYPRYVRINTLLLSHEEIITNLISQGWHHIKYSMEGYSYTDFLNDIETMDAHCFVEDYHIKDLLIFSPQTSFYDCELYHTNGIILQDKGSCLSSFLCDVSNGDRVIDACAAPGNKTSHLAALSGGSAHITAIDRDKKRCQLMESMLKSRGVLGIKILNEDFKNIDSSEYPDIDLILVDPSCSGSGMHSFDREYDRSRIMGLAAFQLDILTHALSFPGVKSVIYSTCSVYSEENEQVVEKALERFGDTFELEALGAKLKGWQSFGSTQYSFGTSCIRTDPDVDRCQGFFIAKFIRRKVGSSAVGHLTQLGDSFIESSGNSVSIEDMHCFKRFSNFDNGEIAPEQNSFRKPSTESSYTVTKSKKCKKRKRSDVDTTESCESSDRMYNGANKFSDESPRSKVKVDTAEGQVKALKEDKGCESLVEVDKKALKKARKEKKQRRKHSELENAEDCYSTDNVNCKSLDNFAKTRVATEDDNVKKCRDDHEENKSKILNDSDGKRIKKERKKKKSNQREVCENVEITANAGDTNLRRKHKKKKKESCRKS